MAKVVHVYGKDWNTCSYNTTRLFHLWTSLVMLILPRLVTFWEITFDSQFLRSWLDTFVFDGLRFLSHAITDGSKSWGIDFTVSKLDLSGKLDIFLADDFCIQYLCYTFDWRDFSFLTSMTESALFAIPLVHFARALLGGCNLILQCPSLHLWFNSTSLQTSFKLSLLSLGHFLLVVIWLSRFHSFKCLFASYFTIVEDICLYEFFWLKLVLFPWSYTFGRLQETISWL